MADRLTHLDEGGAARMVDVSAKSVTERRAVARAVVVMSPQTAAAVRDLIAAAQRTHAPA